MPSLEELSQQNQAQLKAMDIDLTPASVIAPVSDNALLNSLTKNPNYTPSNVEYSPMTPMRAGLDEQKIKVTNLDGSVTERSLTDLMLNSQSTDWMQKALSIALPLANDPTKYKNVYVGGYTEKDNNGKVTSGIKDGLFNADLNQAKELLKDTAAEQYLRTDTPQFDGFKVKDGQIIVTPYVRPVFGTDDEIKQVIIDRKNKEANLNPNETTWDKIGLNIISGDNIKDPKNASLYNSLGQLRGAGIAGFVPFLAIVNDQPILESTSNYFNSLKKDGQNLSDVYYLESNGDITYKNPKTFDEFKFNVNNQIGKRIEGSITGAEALPNFARSVIKGDSDLSLEGYRESTARLERANQNMSTPELVVNKVGGFVLDTTGVVVTSIQAATDVIGSVVTDFSKTKPDIDKNGNTIKEADYSFSDTQKAISNIPNYKPKDYSNPFRSFMDRPEQISPEAEVMSNIVGLLIPIEKLFKLGGGAIKVADRALDVARTTKTGSKVLGLADDLGKKAINSVDDVVKNTLNFGAKEVTDSPENILSSGYNLGQLVKSSIDNLGGVGKELLGKTVNVARGIPSSTLSAVKNLPKIGVEFAPRVGVEIGRQAIYQGIRAKQYATLIDAPSRILDKSIEQNPNNLELKIADKALSIPKDTLIGALTAFNDKALKPTGNTLFDLGKGDTSIAKAFSQQLAIGINPELADRSQQAVTQLNELNKLRDTIEKYTGDKNSAEFQKLQTDFINREKSFSEGAVNNIAKSTGNEFIDMSIQSAAPMFMQYLVSAGLQTTGNQLIRNGVGGKAGSLALAKAVSVTDAPRIGGLVYATQAYNQVKDDKKTDTEKLNYMLQYAGMEIAGDKIGDAIFAGTNKKVYEKLITEIPLGQRVTDSLIDFIDKGGSESAIPTLLWKKAIMEKGLAKATSEGLKNDVVKEYVVANIGKRFISEGISEAGQQILEDQDKPLTEIIKNAGYAGLVGGTLGLFMGGFVNGSAKMLDYTASAATEVKKGTKFENFNDRYNLNSVNKFIESDINPYLPKEMQLQAVGLNVIATKSKDGSLNITDKETFANIFDFNQNPSGITNDHSPVISGTVQDKKNIYSYALIRKDLATYNLVNTTDTPYQENIVIAGNNINYTAGAFDPVAKKFYPLNAENTNPENKSVPVGNDQTSQEQSTNTKKTPRIPVLVRVDPNVSYKNGTVVQNEPTVDEKFAEKNEVLDKTVEIEEEAIKAGNLAQYDKATELATETISKIRKNTRNEILDIAKQFQDGEEVFVKDTNGNKFLATFVNPINKYNQDLVANGDININQIEVIARSNGRTLLLRNIKTIRSLKKATPEAKQAMFDKNSREANKDTSPKAYQAKSEALTNKAIDIVTNLDFKDDTKITKELGFEAGGNLTHVENIINSLTEIDIALEQYDGISGLEDITKEINRLLKPVILNRNNVDDTSQIKNVDISLQELNETIGENFEDETEALARLDSYKKTINNYYDTLHRNQAIIVQYAYSLDNKFRNQYEKYLDTVTNSEQVENPLLRQDLFLTDLRQKRKAYTQTLQQLKNNPDDIQSNQLQTLSETEPLLTDESQSIQPQVSTEPATSQNNNTTEKQNEDVNTPRTKTEPTTKRKLGKSSSETIAEKGTTADFNSTGEVGDLLNFRNPEGLIYGSFQILQGRKGLISLLNTIANPNTSAEAIQGILTANHELGHAFVTTLVDTDKNTFLGGLGVFNNSVGTKFRIIGDIGAKNLNDQVILQNRQVAQEMENGGKDVKTIRLATGWEKGADGKWRYEMPDVKFNDININTLNKNDKYNYIEDKLGKILKDNELFKTYPELRDTELVLYSFSNPEGTTGRYTGNFETPNIALWGVDYSKPELTNEQKSTLIHEIQHAIQDIEGFARGGSSSKFLNLDNPLFAKYNSKDNQKAVKRYNELYNSLEYRKELSESNKLFESDYDGKINELYKNRNNDNRDETLKKVDQLLDDFEYIKNQKFPILSEVDQLGDNNIIRKPVEQFTGYEAYEKLAGEVEARNVQKRFDLTDEQRRQTPLSETEDVSREVQIVRYRNDFNDAEEIAVEYLAREYALTQGLDQQEANKKAKDIWQQFKDFLAKVWQGIKDFVKTGKFNLTEVTNPDQAIVDEFTRLRDEFVKDKNIDTAKLQPFVEQFTKWVESPVKFVASVENGTKFRTQDSNQALYEEARKYKSPEEFVKSQGEPVYHGTSAKIEGDLKYPLYTINNISTAEKYAKGEFKSVTKRASGGGKAQVFELIPNKNSRVLDLRKPEHINLFKNNKFLASQSKLEFSGKPFTAESGLADHFISEDLVKIIKDKKLPFDAILFDDRGGRGIGFIGLNENAFKTKSQLQDIWNEANQPKFRTLDQDTTTQSWQSIFNEGQFSQDTNDIRYRQYQTSPNNLDNALPQLKSILDKSLNNIKAKDIQLNTFYDTYPTRLLLPSATINKAGRTTILSSLGKYTDINSERVSIDTKPEDIQIRLLAYLRGETEDTGRIQQLYINGKAEFNQQVYDNARERTKVYERLLQDYKIKGSNYEALSNEFNNITNILKDDLNGQIALLSTVNPVLSQILNYGLSAQPEYLASRLQNIKLLEPKLIEKLGGIANTFDKTIFLNPNNELKAFHELAHFLFSNEDKIEIEKIFNGSFDALIRLFDTYYGYDNSIKPENRLQYYIQQAINKHQDLNRYNNNPNSSQEEAVLQNLLEIFTQEPDTDTLKEIWKRLNDTARNSLYTEYYAHSIEMLIGINNINSVQKIISINKTPIEGIQGRLNRGKITKSATPFIATGIAGQLQDKFGSNPLNTIATNFSDALGQISNLMYDNNNLIAYASTIGVNNIVPLATFSLVTGLWTKLVPRTGLFTIGGKQVAIFDSKSYIGKQQIALEGVKNNLDKFNSNILKLYELVNTARSDTPSVSKVKNALNTVEDKLSGAEAIKTKNIQGYDTVVKAVEKELKIADKLTTIDGKKLDMVTVFAFLGQMGDKLAFEGKAINTMGNKTDIQDVVNNPEYHILKAINNNNKGYTVTIQLKQKIVDDLIYNDRIIKIGAENTVMQDTLFKDGDLKVGEIPQYVIFKPNELTAEKLQQLGYNTNPDSTDTLSVTMLSTNPIKGLLDEANYKKAQEFVDKINEIPNITQVNIANQLAMEMNNYSQNKLGITGAVVRNKPQVIAFDSYNDQEFTVKFDNQEDILLQNNIQVGAGQTIIDKINDYYENTNIETQKANALSLRKMLQGSLTKTYTNVKNYIDVLSLRGLELYTSKSEILNPNDYEEIKMVVPSLMKDNPKKALEYTLARYTDPRDRTGKTISTFGKNKREELPFGNNKSEVTVYIPKDIIGSMEILFPYQKGWTKFAMQFNTALTNTAGGVIAKGIINNSLANKFLTVGSIFPRLIGEPVKAINNLTKSIYLRLRSMIGADFISKNPNAPAIVEIIQNRLNDYVIDNKNYNIKDIKTLKADSKINPLLKKIIEFSDLIANRIYLERTRGGKTWNEEGNLLVKNTARFANAVNSFVRAGEKVIVPQYWGRISSDIVSNLPNIGGYQKITTPIVASYVMWADMNKIEPNVENLYQYLESKEYQFDRGLVLDITGFQGRSLLQNIASSFSSIDPTARANNYIFAVMGQMQKFANSLRLTPKVLSGKATYSEFNTWMIHGFLNLLGLLIVGAITKSLFNDHIKKARDNISKLEGGTQQYQEAVANLLKIEAQQQNFSDMMGVANFGLGVFVKMTGLNQFPLIGNKIGDAVGALEKTPEQILNEKYAEMRDRTVLSDIEKVKQIGITSKGYALKDDLPLFVNSVALGLQMAGVLPDNVGNALGYKTKTTTVSGVKENISKNFWENLTASQTDEELQARIETQMKRLNSDKVDYVTKQVQIINNEIANQGNTTLARETGLKKMNNLVNQVGADSINKAMETLGIKDIKDVGINSLKRDKNASTFSTTEAKTVDQIKETEQAKITGTSIKKSSIGKSRSFSIKSKAPKIKKFKIKKFKTPKMRVKKIKPIKVKKFKIKKLT